MILRGTAIIMTPTFVRVEMKIIKNKMCRNSETMCRFKENAYEKS